MTSQNDDQLEPASSNLPALTRAHAIAEHGHRDHAHDGGGGGGGEGSDQYELHGDHSPVLPYQILTDTIARVRFTIMLVGFFYTGLCFVVCVLAVCLIAPNLFFMVDQTSPILLHTAQVITSLVALAMGVACLVIIFKQRELTYKLATAEVLIDGIRDVALIQMQAARYSLEDLTERLQFRHHHEASPLDYIDLAKRIGPMISLLMSHERSAITLAMEGFKLYQVIKKVLNK
jgi:hypothetical protein